MIRMLTGATALALTLAFAAGSAIAQERWQSYVFNDENGMPAASLAFGIPETDALLLGATCRADMPGQIEMTLNLPLAAQAADGPTTVSFSAGSRVEARPAVVEGIGAGGEEGKAGPVIKLTLDRHDVLWEILAAASSSRISASGGATVGMHLSGSRAAIAQFLRGCDTIAAGGPVEAADWEPPALGEMSALSGPLFVVGDAPAEATSSFSGGGALPPFPPGTELMWTGSANFSEGVEWLEVQPGRGSGPAAWVQRSALTPISGGATEYQNLNYAANLVLRESPSASAAQVGTVPPRATGIVDQGQLEGNWVMVRYGDVTGWASHDYLLPMFPVPDSEEVGNGEAVTGGEGDADLPTYEVSHEGWQVTCNPCASYEEPVCSLTAGGLPNSVTVVADDASPDRIGDIRIGMDLAPDPQGTLAIVVDGEQAVAIPPADNVYMAMTGEFLLVHPNIDTVLTEMAAGETVAIAFTDTSGQVLSFSLPLAGFSDGVTDLLATSPQYPRDSACRM
jgi:hypothetical protein